MVGWCVLFCSIFLSVIRLCPLTFQFSQLKEIDKIWKLLLSILVRFGKNNIIIGCTVEREGKEKRREWKLHQYFISWEGKEKLNKFFINWKGKEKLNEFFISWNTKTALAQSTILAMDASLVTVPPLPIYLIDHSSRRITGNECQRLGIRIEMWTPKTSEEP